MFKRWMCCVVAVVVLAGAVAAVPAGPAAAQSGVSAEDVAARDQLIANQENLLNTYRCLFGTDTDVVPGGCDNPDTIVPGAAPQNPTQNDLDIRDGLIQSQEALLNVYRCQHNIDTQLVPGGCADQPDKAETTQPPAITGTIFYDGSFYCALRPDQTIVCSGGSGDHIDVPSGQFASIRHYARTGIWCGSRPDLATSCWEWDYRSDGSGWSHVLELNDFYAQFTDITRSYSSPRVYCGLRSDQAISCWYRDGRLLDVPSGAYTDLVVNDEIWCGLRADQTVSCWDPGTEYVEVNAPDGQFASIKVYTKAGVWCGFRPDQTISCWQWEEQRDDGGNLVLTLEEFPGPSGAYTDIILVGEIWCGLKADQTIYCWQGWGIDYDHSEGIFFLAPRKLDGPSGAYTDIILAGTSWCGLGADQSVLCWVWDEDGWGNPALTPLGLDVPNEEYTDITADFSAHNTPGTSRAPQSGVWCGWRADVVVSCWGYETPYDELGNEVRMPVEWDPPDGQFTDVFRPSEHDIWCGLRTDQTVVCWPEDSVPSGWLSEKLSEGQIIDIAYDGVDSWCALRSDGELICASVRGSFSDGEG